MLKPDISYSVNVCAPRVYGILGAGGKTPYYDDDGRFHRDSETIVSSEVCRALKKSLVLVVGDPDVGVVFWSRLVLVLLRPWHLTEHGCLDDQLSTSATRMVSGRHGMDYTWQSDSNDEAPVQSLDRRPDSDQSSDEFP